MGQRGSGAETYLRCGVLVEAVHSVEDLFCEHECLRPAEIKQTEKSCGAQQIVLTGGDGQRSIRNQAGVATAHRALEQALEFSLDLARCASGCKDANDFLNPGVGQLDEMGFAMGKGAVLVEQHPRNQAK